MNYIFEISKYSRSSENDSQRQENLITGILIWCIERNENLLQNIIEKSFAISSKPLKSDFSTLTCKLQSYKRGEDKKIIADAEISSNNNCTLLIENKIIQKDERLLGQVKDYHKHIDTNDNKNSWLLLITPDDKKSIEEEIFNKLNEKHSARTLWISWDDVHDICKGLIENDGNNLLNELVNALDGVILPPVGTLETEATIKLFVSAEDEKGKYWDRESINVGIIPLEKAAQILGIPTNELIKKHTELEKAREEAKKIREAKKAEKEKEVKK